MNGDSTVDVDLDFKDREDILKILPAFVEASIIKENRVSRHPSGIYLQNIPIDPETGISSISYENAENHGFFKIDLLNNYAYSDIESPEEIDILISEEPDWDLLKVKEVVENLPHIHSYYEQIKSFDVKNIHELAAFLALIRPGKMHLRKKPKDYIMKHIWNKNSNKGGYFFKKSHAYAYALMIVVKMNKIRKKYLQ